MGFLKALTILDWISPIISATDQVTTGAGEVAVPDRYKHRAKRILKQRGIEIRGFRFDYVHDSWCLRVGKEDYERAVEILNREL